MRNHLNSSIFLLIYSYKSMEIHWKSPILLLYPLVTNNNYGKSPFILDLPMKNSDFPSKSPFSHGFPIVFPVEKRPFVAWGHRDGRGGVRFGGRGTTGQTGPGVFVAAVRAIAWTKDGKNHGDFLKSINSIWDIWYIYIVYSANIRKSVDKKCVNFWC